jgi:hypothetical protein
MGEEEAGAQQPAADQPTPDQADEPTPDQADQPAPDQAGGNDDGDKPGVKYSE